VTRQRSPLDDIIVLMPWGELGYQLYHAALVANPDYGYLINQGRVFVGLGGYTHSNPQGLLTAALKGKINGQKVPPFKRVVWLEHDHTFPVDVFQRHATYTKPYVSALYTFRDSTEPLPVIYKWSDSRQGAVMYNAVELEAMGILNDDPDASRRGLHKVDVVPMGCLSVAREVYESWPPDRPYFSSGTSPNGTTTGHDVFVCRVAQDAGWPIYVDTSFRVKHYGLIELDDSYFERWYQMVRLPQVLKENEKPKLEVVS
jgi:hypothetical protein